MREARIILPVENAIQQIAVGKLQDAVQRSFGGFTGYRGVGMWTAPKGERLQEDVVIIDIAYEPSKANDAILYDIAWQAREDAHQVEVYLRYGNGNVQMVQELSCMNNGEFEWEALLSDMHRASPPLETPEEKPLGSEVFERELP